MGIILDDHTPTSADEVIGSVLRDLNFIRKDSDLQGGASPKQATPIPVYRLNINDLDSGDALANAYMVGWRYLVERNGQPAYIDLRDADGKAKFTSFSFNRTANDLLEATHFAQDFGENSAEMLEARIIEIPSLYISAVWLSGHNGCIIAYIDARHILEDKKPLPERVFADKIVLAAAELTKKRNPDNSSDPTPTAN